jgi:hypothetical protein
MSSFINNLVKFTKLKKHMEQNPKSEGKCFFCDRRFSKAGIIRQTPNFNIENFIIFVKTIEYGTL